MSLRFFADHCISNTIIQVLREAGHEVLRLKDHMPPDSNDHDVIAKAGELDCLLISLDGDFADIIAYPPSRYKGMIALQVKNRPEKIPMIIQRLKEYVSSNPESVHYQGKLFLIDAHRIRVRK